MSVNNKVLTVNNLKTYFEGEEGLIKAVDGVSFQVPKGKTLGVVGESGCGKSVTARSIMRLIPNPPGKIVNGKIYYYEKNKKIDITSLKPRGRQIRNIRGNKISMIFQEPMSSLNPLYTIGSQIVEAIRLHQNLNKIQARKRAIELLEKVGIAKPSQRVDAYPFELSGGMCQRAMIAMALSCQPNILIADEPTTALDVTIEAQILKLMEKLQKDFGMTIIIITHDLGVVGEMADRIIVMYTGTVVESTTMKELFYNPKHPYTKGLLKSIPEIGKKERLTPIEGSVPNMLNLPQGCYFEPRCPEAMDICKQKEPDTYNLEHNHKVKCWLQDPKKEEALA